LDGMIQTSAVGIGMLVYQRHCYLV